jgi:Saxitoxin biosynthesis operon protein SxtJ
LRVAVSVRGQPWKNFHFFGMSAYGRKPASCVCTRWQRGNVRVSAVHERTSIKDDTQMGSNKSFGLVFAAVFALISLFPLVHGGSIRMWPLPIALAFLAVALAMPSILSPLNRLWFKFGMLLHHVVNPLILGFIFFVIITPMGVATRLFGGKLLTLGNDKAAASYWHRRTPPGPEPESLRNQF